VCLVNVIVNNKINKMAGNADKAIIRAFIQAAALIAYFYSLSP
jgi:hypothetical protein